MTVRREPGMQRGRRGVSFLSGTMLSAVFVFALTGCEPREPEVEEEPPRAAAVEDLSVFIEEQREREIGQVTDQDIAEGVRLTALALEDVARRTMLAHDREFRPGMPAPPITPGLPTDPADVSREDPPEVDTGVERDPGTEAPEQEPPPGRQDEPEFPDQPIQDRWDAFVDRWRDRPIRELTPEERAELRAAARADMPVGYHYVLNDAIRYAREIELQEEHPRPTDRVVTAFNNLRLVMRFLTERYYPADRELASLVAQVEAATEAVNAERPATEQEAATHTFFRRAYDVVNVLDRAALPPDEAPIQEVEVEDVAEP